MLKNRFAFIAIYHQRQAHRRKKHSSMSYRNWNIHIVKRNQKIVKILPHRRYHFPILPINRLQLAAFWCWRMKFVAVLQCAVMREWFLPNLDQRCRPAFRQSLLVPFNFSAHTFQRYWSIDLAERFVEIIWCWEKKNAFFRENNIIFLLIKMFFLFFVFIFDETSFWWSFRLLAQQFAMSFWRRTFSLAPKPTSI